MVNQVSDYKTNKYVLNYVIDKKTKAIDGALCICY